MKSIDQESKHCSGIGIGTSKPGYLEAQSLAYEQITQPLRVFLLFSLILATKPNKAELKSFYRYLNSLPNVSYAIQQVKACVGLHH